MAKTVLSGDWSSGSKGIIYTAPSDKYVKVTVLHFGLVYSNNNRSSYFVGIGYDSSVTCQMGVNDVLMVEGNMPYSGKQTHQTSNSAGSHAVTGFPDGSFLIPPSKGLAVRKYSSGYNIAYYLILEEIDSTTVLA